LAIVDKLKVELLGEEKITLIKRHTADREAHNLYLKGLYFWNRRLEGGMKLAMEHFQQAIEKDPSYTLAHVGIADTYNITGFFGFLPPGETFPRAKAAAKRTLEIDESLGEAHASLAFSYSFYDWNWSAAEKEFKRAIELNPSYATAHEWYAVYLFAMGRFDEAINEAERARELDPLSIIINSVVGIAYYFARRYEESIELHKKALELDPNFLLATTYSTLAYVERGMHDEVTDLIRKAEPLATNNTYSLGYFGGTYGRIGKKDEALRILARLDELAQERYVSPLDRATILVGIGETDKALDEMERAYRERCPIHAFTNTIPHFDCLKSNPRFKELMKKIGF
jgi:tetratricopeptide (TPR) repeat protein